MNTFTIIKRFSTSVSANLKVAVLGSGWSSFSFLRLIDKDLFHVNVISPRNHFLFTPLLPSASVGTLEFRCIQEPVRTIPNIEYHQAEATHVDFKEKTIDCEEIFTKSKFSIDYDILLICTGSFFDKIN